jgi:hypothetical protein
MATKRVADHTLYHLSPKGFWKKFSGSTYALLHTELVIKASRRGRGGRRSSDI